MISRWSEDVVQSACYVGLVIFLEHLDLRQSEDSSIFVLLVANHLELVLLGDGPVVHERWN